MANWEFNLLREIYIESLILQWMISQPFKVRYAKMSTNGQNQPDIYERVHRLIIGGWNHIQSTLFFYIRTNYYWPRLSCSYFWTRFCLVFNFDPPWIICLKYFLWSPLFVFLFNLHLAWIVLKMPISEYQFWGSLFLQKLFL